MEGPSALKRQGVRRVPGTTLEVVEEEDMEAEEDTVVTEADMAAIEDTEEIVVTTEVDTAAETIVDMETEEDVEVEEIAKTAEEAGTLTGTTAVEARMIAMIAVAAGMIVAGIPTVTTVGAGTTIAMTGEGEGTTRSGSGSEGEESSLLSRLSWIVYTVLGVCCAVL